MIAAVARNCPSGAIQYHAKEPMHDEEPPPINVVRLRENGPYAFHGQLQVRGEREETTRRTLCRCGASCNKPYCDGSHVSVGFIATGEPESQTSAPLAIRAGRLDVTPMRDGPIVPSSSRLHPLAHQPPHSTSGRVGRRRSRV